MTCKSILAKVIIIGAGSAFLGVKAMAEHILEFGYVHRLVQDNFKDITRFSALVVLGNNWNSRSAETPIVFLCSLAPRWVKPHAPGACMDLTLES